jgi:capsid portal protein
MVTGGKVSIARLDTDFQKMDLNALRKGLRDFIRMNWRIPPEIVGDLTSSNKATAWAAHDNLAKNCIVPRAEFLRTEFQMRLMPRLRRPRRRSRLRVADSRGSEFTSCA